jgi:hypothetical protein
MDRPRRRRTAEPLAITLIFACVIATLGTVITVHRRPPAPQPSPVVVAPAAPEVKVAEPEAPKPLPASPSSKPAALAAVPEDPTKPIVAGLAKAESEQRLETARADRQVAAIDAATRAAKSESERWKRGVTLTIAQLDARAAEARRKESLVETALMERDALARRRDMLKKTLAADRARPSYAVLPHKGPNGTWQRPIVLECKNDSVTLRPNGPTFGILDLSPSFGGRTGGPFAAAISREAIRIQRQIAPDGADITPYIFFIIRPDGIQAYYEARTRLERLGIAFGYELADPDWAIDVPDLDNPTTWDGSPPPVSTHDDSPADLAGHGGEGTGPQRASREEIDKAFTWPKTPPGMDESRSGRGYPAAGLGASLERLVPGDDTGDGTGNGLAEGGTNGAGAGAGRGGSGPPGSVPTGSGTAGPGRGGERRGLSEEVWNRALGMSGPGRPIGLSQGGTGTEAADGSTSGADGHGTDRLSGTRPGFPKRPIGVGRGPNGLAGSGRLDGLLASMPRGNGPTGSVENMPKGEGTGDSSTPEAGTGGGSGTETGTPGLTPAPGRAGLQGTGRSGAGSGAGSGSTGSGSAGSGAGSGTEPGSGGQPSGGSGSSGPRQGGQSGGSASAAGMPGQDGSPSDGGRPGSPGGASGGMPSRFGSPSHASTPLELVVACSAKGVAVHPGNYRVTTESLKSKDDLLVSQLRAIVRKKERAGTGAMIEPSIRFVIEPGGHENYGTAKAQVLFSGLDWPTSLQVTGGDTLRLFSTDGWK